jgi:hypothetical protein
MSIPEVREDKALPPVLFEIGSTRWKTSAFRGGTPKPMDGTVRHPCAAPSVLNTRAHTVVTVRKP